MTFEAWPWPLALAALAVLLVIEAGLLIGVVLPAATTVLAIGVATAHGLVPLWAAVLVTAAASALGSHWGYRRGRAPTAAMATARAVVVRRWGVERHDRLLAALGRRSRLTLALCQCFGVVRTVAPRLAGPAGVSPVRHAMATVPAAAVWATVLIMLGRSAGAAYATVERSVGYAGPVAACLVLIVVGSAAAWRRVRRRRA